MSANPPPRPTVLQRCADRPWWLLGLCLVAVVALRAPGFSQHVFNPDEAYVQTEARVLVHGGHLYRDIVDRKPPAMPLLTYGVMELTGSESVLTYRIPALLATVATAWLLGREARRRFGGRAALPAVGLFLVATVAIATVAPGQAANEETFVIVGMVAALVAARRGRLWLAGLAIAAAMLTKQTAVFLVPAVLVAIWPRHRWRSVVPLVVPTVVITPIVAVLLGWRGYWFWNGGGASSDYLSLPRDLTFTVANARSYLFPFLVGVGALTALTVVAARRWREHLDLWVWVAGGLAASALGFRFLDHYFLQVLPGLVLLGAAGWELLEGRAARVAVAALALLPAAFGLYDGWRLAATRTPVQETVDYVRDHTRPGDRIFVWGAYSELFDWTDRLPATRFVTSGFLTGHSPGRRPGARGEHPVPHAWADFDTDVAAHPPALILDVAPAGFRDAGHYPMAAYPDLASLVRRDYVLVAVTDGIAIYRRAV